VLGAHPLATGDVEPLALEVVAKPGGGLGSDGLHQRIPCASLASDWHSDFAAIEGQDKARGCAMSEQLDNLGRHKVNEVNEKSPTALQKKMRGIIVVAG
jgi:hypothetical protein